MMIVGQISTPEEAKEIELAAKIFVVGNRARALAAKIKKRMQFMKNKEKNAAKQKKTLPTEIPIIWVNILP